MNILIVGLGSIARKHVKALKEIAPDSTIYALRSSPDSSPYENVIDLYNISSVETLNLDFIIISNPTSEHLRTIKMMLSMGLPLFIEKPLSDRLNLQSLLDEIKRRDILTYVGCNMRFLDCLGYVKRNLDSLSDKINEITVYCGSYLPDWRPGIDFRKNYSALPELGGGVHLDLIHELDYIYWFLGEPVSVKKTFSNKSSLKIKSVDYANYLLEYDTFYVNVILNYFRRDAKRYMEIVSDSLTWYVDLLDNTVSINGEYVFNSHQSGIDTYRSQLKYFISLMKDPDSKSMNSIFDAYNVLKICLYDETKR